MPKSVRWYFVSALVIVVDYLTKAAVLASFSPGEGRVVAPFFNLVLVFNKGAAFSFLAGAQGWQTLFFAAIAIVASIVISFLIYKNQKKNLLCGGLALILGGALGNLIDRVRFGEVVDFIEIGWGRWHWPVFNVADSAVTIGVVLFALTWSRAPAPAGPAGPVEPDEASHLEERNDAGAVGDVAQRGGTVGPIPRGGADGPVA